MNRKAIVSLDSLKEIDYEQFITEDDTPVDSLFSDQQQRLLVESLFTSWKPSMPFLAAANIGVYYDPDCPPVVPDMLLSLGVNRPENLHLKKNKVYFTWLYGKSPDVVIEVVSNREGEELGRKLKIYEEIGVEYYAIFDPFHHIIDTELHVYQMHDSTYRLKADRSLVKVGLGLTVSSQEYEHQYSRWLRWCDQEGNLLQTGIERAEQERMLKEQERMLKEQERTLKEKYAAKLKALGIDPDS